VALRAAAENLEHHARSDGLDGIAVHTAAVRTEFERAQAALKALVAS
jgi:hypothetical protein